jgi:hypothetical protein
MIDLTDFPLTRVVTLWIDARRQSRLRRCAQAASLRVSVADAAATKLLEQHSVLGEQVFRDPLNPLLVSGSSARRGSTAGTAAADSTWT